METQQTLSFEITSSVHKRSSGLVFEHLMNETIDNVFSSLGLEHSQAIFDYVEMKYGLKKNDVADHIKEFSEALEQIFGDAAALLEIEIMKKLCRKIPQFKHRQEGTLNFPDYVKALSRFFSNC
jgi:hypothetical protein